jgi:hypothetical protein
VELDELLDDRQPEAETAVAARRRSVGLPKTFEDVGQECTIDSFAVVRDGDFQLRASLPSVTDTQPAFGVNLTAFVSKFQNTCCNRFGSPRTGPVEDRQRP